MENLNLEMVITNTCKDELESVLSEAVDIALTSIFESAVRLQLLQ